MEKETDNSETTPDDDWDGELSDAGWSDILIEAKNVSVPTLKIGKTEGMWRFYHAGLRSGAVVSFSYAMAMGERNNLWACLVNAVIGSHGTEFEFRGTPNSSMIEVRVSDIEWCVNGQRTGY